MLHLAARLQRLTALAPRVARPAALSSAPLPLPALCQLLSTCSSTHLQPLACTHAAQLSSLLLLAARPGAACAEALATCSLGRWHAAGQRRVLSASAACQAAAATEREHEAGDSSRGAASEQARQRRALHASAPSQAVPAVQRELGAGDGTAVLEEQGHGLEEDVSVEEQRRRMQAGLVATLQHSLQVSGDFVDWGQEHLVMHPTYHDYQFSAKAFHVGRGLGQQARQLYRVAAERGFPSFWNTAEWRLICLGKRPPAPADNAAAVAGETETGLPYDEPYVAVFENMDTVVFFNGCGNEAQLWQQFAGGVLPTREIEELRVFVRPQMASESMILADSIGLKAAQPDKIKTIAYLLAQTVALHFYETEVDTMLRAFQDINSDMERTGELVAAMAKGELLKMVARNNVMRTGILSSKIGLTKRFDAAWRDAECSRIYEHLREEMEITRRYEDLEVKFDLIQDNLKYFLEIIQNKKSDFLEYLIVILIAAEIFVSLFDMWTRDAFSG